MPCSKTDNAVAKNYFDFSAMCMYGVTCLTMIAQVEPSDATSAEPPRVAFLQLRAGATEGMLLWRVELAPRTVSRIVVLIGGCVSAGGEAPQLLLWAASFDKSTRMVQKTLQVGFNELCDLQECSWLQIGASLCRKDASKQSPQLFRQAHSSR